MTFRELLDPVKNRDEFVAFMNLAGYPTRSICDHSCVVNGSPDGSPLLNIISVSVFIKGKERAVSLFDWSVPKTKHQLMETEL